MTKLDSAREWLARGLIAAGKYLAKWTCPAMLGRKLAGLVCPHRYGSLAKEWWGGRYICGLCGKDITDPPFMALRVAWARCLDWYAKRYRKLN